MKIKRLSLPDELSRRLAQRCCKSVRNPGGLYFPPETRFCTRVARFEVDGVKLCAQHAGEAALIHVLKQTDQ